MSLTHTHLLRLLALVACLGLVDVARGQQGDADADVEQNAAEADAGAAEAASLRAAADRGHGWLILPRGERFEVYHHAPGDDWLAWRRTDAILLTLPEQAACAGDDRGRSELVVAFPPAERPGQRDVRRKQAVFNETVRRWIWEPTGRLEITPALPGDSALQGLVTGPRGRLFALIQGQSLSVARPGPPGDATDEPGPLPDESAEATDDRAQEASPGAGEASNPPDAERRAVEAVDETPAAPVAGRIRAPADDAESAGGEDAESAVKPHVGPATRLLRLDEAAWVEVPLPAGVDRSDDLPWRLLASPQGVALLARDAGATRATLYQLDDDSAWTAQRLPIDLESVFAAGTSGGGLVVARRVQPAVGTPTGDPEAEAAFDLSLELVRSGAALPIATVPAVTPDAAVLLAGPDAVIITEGEQLQPLIRVYELATGRLRQEGRFGEPPLLTQRSLQPLLIVFALLVAAVAMVVFKPEPGAVVVAVGSETEPADIAGRLLAFLIDLLPTMIVVGLFSGITLAESLLSLRSVVLFQATTETLPPALAILLLTLIHQALSEWLTGRTLGKRLTGLEVLDALGGSLSFRQAAVRNALKFVLLLFPILLLLAIWSPWRQHLGDMAGRTVVAGRRPGEEQPPRE